MSIKIKSLSRQSILFLFTLIILINISSAQSVSDTSITKLVLLGTGTPNADPARSGSSVAVVVRDTPYLIDFGPGVVRRAAAAARNGIKALKVSKIRHVFATHLHSDHTAGYADLILTPWVLGRRQPLEVYGPEGIKHMTDHILKAYERDIFLRLYGLEPANSHGYKVNAREIKPGLVYRDSNVTVEAFPVRHGSWHHVFGYRFNTPDKVVVISGDTAPCDTLIDYAKDCDILLHEVYSAEKYKQRTPFWKKYHAAFHTSTMELAEIARQTQPKLLVLYHQLFWGATDSMLVDEIKTIYDGDVVSGRDLDVF